MHRKSRARTPPGVGRQSCDTPRAASPRSEQDSSPATEEEVEREGFPASAIAYTWDDNGDLTDRGSDTFTWDYEDRMTSATVNSATTTFAYRGDGLRDSRTVGLNTTTFTWDINAGLPVVLDDGNQYVYGAGLESMVTGTGSYYYLADGLGSTMAVVDDTGTVQKSYTYDVYGETTATGTLGNEFDFAGQQTDASTGLQYLRARYMDPETGTLLSRDPLAARARWGGGHFGYAGASPLNLVDPTGLDGVEFGPPSWCSVFGVVAKKGCNEAEEVKEEVSGAVSDVTDGWRQNYIDVNVTGILPITPVLGVGITAGCQFQIDDPALHCYAGVAAGLPGVSASATVAPGQTITEGVGCGAQISGTVPVGPVGVGPTGNGGVGGIGSGGLNEKGGNVPYGEGGVTVSLPPGVGANAGCYYMSPNLLDLLK